MYPSPFHRLWLLILLVVSSTLHAQTELTGDVDYPYLGIKLTIPAGWKGIVDGEYLLLGSDTEAGLIGLTLNEARSTAQLKQVADAGWIDDGINMTRSGDFEQIGAEGMGAEFSGQFQGQNARAFIAGVINGYGNSVTIIAITSVDQYGPRQSELVKAIADSLQFAVPAEAPHNPEWRRGLAGKTLSYMQSSYSSDPSYTDSYGQTYSAYSSYSSRHEIQLCSDRSFFSSNSSSSSFDASGGFGAISGNGSGQGQWQVATSAEGESLLQLTYHDGSVAEYRLDFVDGKTMLDGSRYFRTESEVCR